MKNKNILCERKATLERPLVLDGAMGTLLQQRSFIADKNLWYSGFNISNPQIIRQIHEEYISAGANIITTNTFRTNPIAKRKSNIGLTNTAFVEASVKLALEAKLLSNSNVIIAGSNAPAEDCYQKERTVSQFDLEYNHKKHIELLYESKCDIIWNETHSHMDEIQIICKYCFENSIPYSINLYFEESLKILSGELVFDVVESIKDYSPQSIGFNCVKVELLEKYLDNYPIPTNFGFYLNCGVSNVCESIIVNTHSPTQYLELTKKYFNNSLLFVGSCCGSTPKHTEVLKENIDALYRN